jgi:hypothetical protein
LLQKREVDQEGPTFISRVKIVHRFATLQERYTGCEFPYRPGPVVYSFEKPLKLCEKAPDLAIL